MTWPVALTNALNCAVRHRRAIDPEGVDRHAVDRRFFGVMIVGTHAEGAAGNRDHVVGPAILRWRVVPLGGRPAATSWRKLQTCAVTDRRPGSPASCSDRCSTSSDRGRARASRSHHRGGDQSDYGARGDRAVRAHTFESLRCAATLTNMRHHCRLHFQALSCFARHVIDVRSEDIGQHPFPSLVTPRNKFCRPEPTVNLKLSSISGEADRGGTGGADCEIMSRIHQPFPSGGASIQTIKFKRRSLLEPRRRHSNNRGCYRSVTDFRRGLWPTI